MYPDRISPPAIRRRSPRWAKWHRKGYRDCGYMWINVKSEGSTRGQDVSETDTLERFVRSLDRKPDFTTAEVWCDVYFRRTSLFEILEDHPDDLVSNWFDGGETVIRKFYDIHAQELDGFGESTGKVHKNPRFPPVEYATEDETDDDRYEVASQKHYHVARANPGQAFRLQTKVESSYDRQSSPAQTSEHTTNSSPMTAERQQTAVYRQESRQNEKMVYRGYIDLTAEPDFIDLT